MEQQNEPLFRGNTQLTLERQYKFNTKHSLAAIIACELIFLICGTVIALLQDDIIMKIAFAIGFAAGIAIFPPLFYISLKRNLVKLMAKSPLQDDKNFVEISFFEENLGINVTRLGETISTSTIKYENLVKVTRFKELLLIYIGIGQVHIFDSACMDIGNFESLLAFLKTKIKKGL